LKKIPDREQYVSDIAPQQFFCDAPMRCIYSCLYRFCILSLSLSSGFKALSYGRDKASQVKIGTAATVPAAQADRHRDTLAEDDPRQHERP
jgi:hypothetical protein